MVTTSNTPPEAQGRGRFNADDFRREIQSLASGFEVLSIDGPDYRHRDRMGAWLRSEQVAWLALHERARGPRVVATWDEVLALIAGVHPSRFAGVASQMGTLYLTGVRPIATQHEALRVVHFLDALYDQGVGLRAAGSGALTELFDAGYRDGAYAKKHYRCLSRLSEMLEEAPADASPVDRTHAVAPHGEPRA